MVWTEVCRGVSAACFGAWVVGCGGRSFRLSPKIGASAVSPQVRFAPARRAGGRGEHSLFGTGSVTGVAHGAFLADQQSGNDGHSSREVKGAEAISKGAGTITICQARKDRKSTRLNSSP